MTEPTILLLAAGRSARMRGRDKLLEDVAGQPLLRLMASRATKAAVPGARWVLGPDQPTRRRGRSIGLAVEIVEAEGDRRHGRLDPGGRGGAWAARCCWC